MFILRDLAKFLIPIAMIVFSISVFAQNNDSEQKDSKQSSLPSNNQKMSDKGENESILEQSREQMVKTDVVLSDEQLKAYGDSIRVLLEPR